MSTAKSGQIVNAEKIPTALATPGILGGKVRQYTATIEIVAATDINDIGDIIKMVRVPSQLCITNIVVMNDDLDSNVSPTLAVDVGMYRADNGVVVSANCFAAAQTLLQAANRTGTELVFSALDFANIGKPAWQLAGLTADPGTDLDVSLTVTAAAATGANGTISVLVRGALAN